MNKVFLPLSVLLVASALGGCRTTPPPSQAEPPASPPGAIASTVSPTLSQPTHTVPPVMPSASPIAAADLPDRDQLLQQSWATYRQRFIQVDGRVIDREAGDRTTSEAQAYAMLRAVMIADRDAFDRTLQWAEDNLQRQSGSKLTDRLWAWSWGRNPAGQWGVLDANFASDADIDAITALILAARRWDHPPYLELARTKLQDLWNYSTVAGAVTRSTAKPVRYLLPGPARAFQQQTTLQLNPSYFAPYAFRLFAQVDPARNWLSLVDGSYQVLEQAATLSQVGLPNDWVLLNLPTGTVEPLNTPRPGTSEYGFDAYRVWWRVALDASWFQEPRAKQYLKAQLTYPQQVWRSRQSIPARIDLQGKPLVDYEATSQYAMLYTAFQLTDPTIAAQIERQKIMPQYRNGFWDHPSAYYTQNLVWLSLVPSTAVSSLLRP